ncbi:MAG: NAD(P)-binding domain-containing protein, partial [Pseudoflavonifractor sp.]
MNLGFIGAGNMASAILSGVLAKKLIPAEHIWMSNRSPEKLRAPAAGGVNTTLDNGEVARRADVLILAVKPQMF